MCVQMCDKPNDVNQLQMFFYTVAFKCVVYLSKHDLSNVKMNELDRKNENPQHLMSRSIFSEENENKSVKRANKKINTNDEQHLC